MTQCRVVRRQTRLDRFLPLPTVLLGRQEEGGRRKTTTDTSGPTRDDSSPSAALRSSSVSRSLPPPSSDLLVRVRTCKKCGTEKPYSEFYVNSKGHRRRSCKDCDKAAERIRKRKNPPGVAAKFKKWRKEKRGHALVSAAKQRAKVKGLPFDLDPEDIQRRIDAGQCELSGIPFDLSVPRGWNAPSLDRIESGLGYTTGNVRVVLYALNIMSHTWGPNRILEIASAISTRRVEASNSLSERIGQRLTETVGTSGSMEYNLIWQRKVTPSGHVIYRLRASGRRTSDSDFTGWPTPAASEPTGELRLKNDRQTRDPNAGGSYFLQLGQVAELAGWATPTANEKVRSEEYSRGRELNAREALAGWATPAARDFKSESATDEFNEKRWDRPRGKPLSARATMVEGSGTTSASFTAGMGSPGVLNPEHSRWLMGYPAAWLSCVDWATRSSRRSRPSSSEPTSKSGSDE